MPNPMSNPMSAMMSNQSNTPMGLANRSGMPAYLQYLMQRKQTANPTGNGSLPAPQYMAAQQPGGNNPQSGLLNSYMNQRRM